MSVSDIINMRHPVPSTQSNEEMQERIRKVQAEMAKNGTGSRAVRMSSGDTDHAKEVQKFYGTVRVFIDFLKHTSKDPKIFDAIARSISKGDDFEKWLIENHKKFKLEATLESLNRQWVKYVGNIEKN
jgi:hypothetical protein